jgi:hypothetical protein
MFVSPDRSLLLPPSRGIDSDYPAVLLCKVGSLHSPVFLGSSFVSRSTPVQHMHAAGVSSASESLSQPVHRAFFANLRFARLFRIKKLLLYRSPGKI